MKMVMCKAYNSNGKVVYFNSHNPAIVNVGKVFYQELRRFGLNEIAYISIGGAVYRF